MTDLEQIQLELADAEKAVKRRDLALKMFKSYAYKEVVERGFMEENLINAAPLASSPNEAASKGAVNVCIAVGSLQCYLNAVIRQGDAAEQAIVEHKAAQLGIVNEE